MEVGVFEVYGCRPVSRPESMANILHRLHLEGWSIQISGVQPLEIEDGSHAAIFLGDEKNGADVGEKRGGEGDLFDGSLGREGLHLLVDVMVVLSLGGGLKFEPRQGKGWGGK
jgi:hypothetical protein